MMHRIFCSLLMVCSIGLVANGSFASIESDYSLCCADVSGPCKEACENFSLVQYAAQPDVVRTTQLADIKRQCPHSMDTFWTCLDDTLIAVERGHQWSGRHCCTLGILPRCRHACATSASGDEVAQTCRRSDEPGLFACLRRQTEADECCGRARTAACMQQCQTVFARRGDAVSVGQRDRLHEVCAANGTSATTSASGVLGCVIGMVNETPNESFQEYAACCDKTDSPECKRTCIQALRTEYSTQQIIDVLESGGCGPPLPHDPLWQCFLATGGKQSSPAPRNGGAANTSGASTAIPDQSLINQIGMDAAKQHCCHKAVAAKCRRLCVQTFTNDWTRSRQRFESECYGQAGEAAMRQCLDEVDEPCRLGCSGLSYCKHFNNRPTQLFRSCSAEADGAARADYNAWLADGSVNLTVLNIPIKNLQTCMSDAWQAIVCTLQIRPCARRGHSTRICRADCLDVLSRCLDMSRALPAGHSAESICSAISPIDPDEPCIDLADLMRPATASTATTTAAVRFPCSKADRCAPGEVCTIDGDTERAHCTAACRLGETSTFHVAVGRYVRVPAAGARQPGCHKVCRCGAAGRMELCQPLPCIAYEACMMAGRRIEHATSVRVECNVCSCYAGEITCTKRQCRLPGGGTAAATTSVADGAEHRGVDEQRVAGFTSLPCNCAAHYVPVCGRNGQTYPSLCVAKCAGIPEADLEFGACDGMADACTAAAGGHQQCPANGECVPMRQVCLSVMQRPCVQYVCVNESTDLLPPPLQLCPIPADTNQPPTLVCGINGVTYPSECAALADHSWPDYDGPCREFGRLNEPTPQHQQRCSASIICPEDAHRPCATTRVQPPGACCTICAAAVRIVYSRKQIDRALYALPGREQHLVTLQGVLAGLQRLVQTAGCRISGYLTVETDLFVAVHSVRPPPSAGGGDDDHDVHVVACAREAERLATLIETQTAQIVSDVALSALIGARMVDGVAPSDGSRSAAVRPEWGGGRSGRWTMCVAWRVHGLCLVMLWMLCGCGALKRI